MKYRLRLGASTLLLPVAAAICLSDHAVAEPVAAVIPVMHAEAKAGMPASTAQGYLGVDIRDVSQGQMKALKLKNARGAEIVHVDHDGPAGKLGLRQHDVILEVNGQQIEGQEQLRRLLRETPAGRSITLTISRDGRQQTMTTQLENRAEVERRAWEQHLVVPDPSRDDGPGAHVGSGFLHSDSLSVLGARARRDLLGPATILSASFTGAQLEVMGPQLADFFGVGGKTGLLVRSVEAKSPAADAGLQAGDVILQINQTAVTSGNEWSKTIHQNRGKPVTLVVLRDRHEQTMTITPDSKKRSSLAWPAAGGPQGSQGSVADL